MKEASVLLIAIVMILSTVAVTANTNNQSPEFISAGGDYILQPQPTNTFDPNWLHFDNGNNADALGLIQGGTFEFAIRLTPDELGDWAGYQIETVRHHHGHLDPFWMAGNIKIYEGGTPIQPGDVITTEPFQVTDAGWFDVNLSEPVSITGDEDIWVSVQATHYAGQYPAGMDNSLAVDGKGDWLYLTAWEESQGFGFDCNFNIWAGIVSESEPPDTPEQPDGPTEGIVGVEYIFLTSTNDPEGEQVSYLWDWGDETPTEWTEFYDSGENATASHSWDEPGDYNITVKAKDVYNEESDWSDPLAIHILIDSPILEIGNITGGLFKVSTVIGNIGGVDANGVNWSITLDDGFILLGKKTTGKVIDIPVGENVIVVSKPILGFGKTVVTVTAEESGVSSDTKERNASIFLFFIEIEVESR